MNEEYLDLVDANDQKIGTIGRSQIGDLQPRQYVRASHGFIQNSKGELWIPRRTSHKRIAPNGLDLAVGEHVGVDETYLNAVIRGFQEELNVIVQPADLKLLGILSPLPSLPYFCAYYLYKTDDAPDYNREDFSEAHWMMPEDALTMIKGGEIAKLCLKPGVELLKICSE